jgi:hypothetical protein
VIFAKCNWSDQVKEENLADRACSSHGEKRKADRMLVGKPGGKRLLGRYTLRCEDNIKMDFGEIGWVDMD